MTAIIASLALFFYVTALMWIWRPVPGDVDKALKHEYEQMQKEDQKKQEEKERDNNNSKTEE